MKKAGIALISLGFYCVLFAFNMDVVVGTTYNIGLMNERQNVVFLSGIILFGFGFSAKEEAKNINVFAIACFLSPILLLCLIGIVFFIQEDIKRKDIEKKKKQVEIRMLTENSKEFIDNKNGTVTHSKTGLIWQRCSIGQNWTGQTCEGNAEKLTWNNSMKLAGNGWKIPTNEELRTLVYCSDNVYNTLNKEDYGYICLSNKDKDSLTTVSPTINSIYFPNTPPEAFWSSSVTHDNGIWYVYFGSGITNIGYDGFNRFVRLVKK